MEAMCSESEDWDIFVFVESQTIIIKGYRESFSLVHSSLPDSSAQPFIGDRPTRPTRQTVIRATRPTPNRFSFTAGGVRAIALGNDELLKEKAGHQHLCMSRYWMQTGPSLLCLLTGSGRRTFPTARQEEFQVKLKR
ncbi:hypothetical protein ACLOJK_016009 [Asimina triloba]